MALPACLRYTARGELPAPAKLEGGATWNINSIRARKPRRAGSTSTRSTCSPWKTKIKDETFPFDLFEFIGYEVLRVEPVERRGDRLPAVWRGRAAAGAMSGVASSGHYAVH